MENVLLPQITVMLTHASECRCDYNQIDCNQTSIGLNLDFVSEKLKN